MNSDDLIAKQEEELERHLVELVEEWAYTVEWNSEDEISGAIADTNSIYDDLYFDGVQVWQVDSGVYSFRLHGTYSGSPRKDDVPFCGDTIAFSAEGKIRYDEDFEEWDISDNFNVSAGVEDWRDDDDETIFDHGPPPPNSLMGIAMGLNTPGQRTFNSADELIAALSELPPKAWYRGHGVESWGLMPSIAREANASLSLERMLRLEFENQTTFLDPASHPLGIGKCNFLMQHHGLPTRLMDWSTSPLVALYFAVYQPEHDKKDACLWMLDPSQLNNFHREKFPLECDGDNENLFEEVSHKVLAIHAPYTDLRMKMQRSEFTLHTHYGAVDADIKSSVFLKEKIIISHRIKASLRNKLQSLGIDRSTLFPDLDNIAQSVRDILLEEIE